MNALTMHFRRLVAALAMVVAIAAIAAPAAPAAPPLVAGAPPLLQADLDRVTDLLAQAIEHRFTAAERLRLREIYVRAWRARNQDEIVSFIALRDTAEALALLPAAAREQAMRDFRAEFVPALHSAAASDADARWLDSLRPAATRSPAAVATDRRPPALLPPADGASRVSESATLRAGVEYAPPPNWSRQNMADAVVFRATLRPEQRAMHQAQITVFHPVAAQSNRTAQFEAEWRRHFASLASMDTVAHYRSRLPGGVNAWFMGRSFDRPNGQSALYGVLYMLDLGSQVQVIAATVYGGWDGVQFGQAVDGSAYNALAQSLFGFLDSIRAPGVVASGGFFAPSDVVGRWSHSDGSVGASYVNTATGGFAGTAVRGASSQFNLSADGRYEWSFAMYAYQPAGGGAPPQAQQHNGRYRWSDDVIEMQPQQRIGIDTRLKIVGAGRAGNKRVLIAVAPTDGQFRHVMWVPQWNRYDGVMTWYVEQ